MFKRAQFKELESRLSEPRNKIQVISGPRQVGKSTMVKQVLQETDIPYMFVSADNIDHVHTAWIGETWATARARMKVTQAEEYLLVIDEIHKYENWSRELKQIYDSHPDVKVGFTGSSVLDIYKGFADLSRRAPVFMMQGLSFREYLQLFHDIKVPVYTLDDVLALSAKVADVSHPLPLFRDYLQRGYYPFSGESDFGIRLRQVINQTMEVDILQYANMNASTGRKLKKLLAVIAQSVPFKPVMDSLATVVGVSRNVLPDYFLYMEQAGMIGQLRDDTGGIKGVGKVEKVYLDNTNMAYLLGGDAADIGNIRETFFFNQMRVVSDVISSRISDFEIDGKTFEVGGKNKGKKQLSEAKEGYVVKDDIEFGSGNIIPLWAFGLLY